jgi:hypothetical protein
MVEITARVEEASTLSLGDFNIYPYARLEDAREGVRHASNHFREEFRIRTYDNGYFLASPGTITDARGFVVSDDSPLDGGQEVFYRILHESRIVE